MSFELPTPADGISSAYLRDLEQNAPKTTPKEIRAALVGAAQQLERWEQLGRDAARQLDEAANVRISQMATISQADEVQRGVKCTMLELARQFRELV